MNKELWDKGVAFHGHSCPGLAIGFRAATPALELPGLQEGAKDEELVCHIDDMTAEALAFAGERLLEDGALDVSTAPITMKKGRPAWALTVLCRPADEERLAKSVLRETSTLGVRVRRCERYTLAPSLRTVETAYGPMAVKVGQGFGFRREKPEYRDVARAAKDHSLPFQKVWEDVLAAAREDRDE